MANFNKVILMGRLTAAPELKTTTSGISVCSFSVAVNRRIKPGEEQKADFFNCTAWRQTAEFVSKYFSKGSSICIVGSLQNRSWQDQQGNKRTATEIVVDEAIFVDSKSTAAQNGPAGAYTPNTDYRAESAPRLEPMQNDGDLPF